MTPRLVLLTGPEAGEVSKVFNFLVHGAESAEVRLWDEVRDYWEAPRCIAGVPDAVAIEYGIREYPGGEAWLVGLVLPEPRESYCHTPYNHPYPQWECVECRGYTAPRMSARLAILAPEPPPLLVERVRAWGGEVWNCDTITPKGPHKPGTLYCCIDTPQGLHDAGFWCDVVRKALGEVTP